MRWKEVSSAGTGFFSCGDYYRHKALNTLWTLQGQNYIMKTDEKYWDSVIILSDKLMKRKEKK